MNKLNFASDDDLKTSKGKIVRIFGVINSNSIGGSVWLTDQSSYFAKLFHHSPNADFEAKLRWMVENPPPGVINSLNQVMVSWPEDLLFRGNQIVGILIPKTSLDWTLNDQNSLKFFQNPPSEGWNLNRLAGGKYPSIKIGSVKIEGAWSQQSFVVEEYERLINWQDRLEIAINLARVCEILHQGNTPYIFDIGSNNVMIHKNNQVTLIDVDSIPLIQNTSNTDSENLNQSNGFFGLAKLLFGVLLYDMNFLLKILPPETENLFRQQQPTTPLEQHQAAEQWRIALSSARKGVKSCPKQKNTHFYHSFLNECPWCDLDLSIRTRLFPEITNPSNPSNFNLYFAKLLYLGLFLLIGWCCSLAWPYAVKIYSSVRNGVVEREKNRPKETNSQKDENDPTWIKRDNNTPRKYPGKGGFSD